MSLVGNDGQQLDNALESPFSPILQFVSVLFRYYT